MERPNKHTMILFGGLALLLLLLGLFLATRDSDQDVLGDSASYLPADNPDLNKACSGQPVYDQIKRALFRQAAQARGNSTDEYEKIAAAASVRMENPVAEGQSGTIIDCAGSLFIDLPPGVATVAGRHMLMSDVYYGVAATGGGPKKVVQLRNAGSLIETLATLVLVPQQAAPPPIAPSAEPPVDDLAALPPATGELRPRQPAGPSQASIARLRGRAASLRSAPTPILLSSTGRWPPNISAPCPLRLPSRRRRCARPATVSSAIATVVPIPPASSTATMVESAKSATSSRAGGSRRDSWG